MRSIAGSRNAYLLTLTLVMFICSCTSYGRLSITQDDSEEADAIELKFKHNWGGSLERYSTGRALYSENVRLTTQHPFRSAEMVPINRFFEFIEISEGNNTLIVIEYEETFNEVTTSDLHLYITVPEIMIGQSIRIGSDSNSFTIGYDSAKGCRYDLGDGYVEFISSGDDGLEILIDIKYMAFGFNASTTPDSHASEDPLHITIKGTVKAQRDTAWRRIFSRDSYTGWLISACL